MASVILVKPQITEDNVQWQSLYTAFENSFQLK